MKRLGCYIFVLVFALVFVSAASANPRGEMKSSPLFKASLEKSIAKLEGKASTSAVNADAESESATSKPGCVQPNAPLTQQTTCEPSWCGGETCMGELTCISTCELTCWSTCGQTCSTCQQPTCYNTCVYTCVGDPGACKNYPFAGIVWWYDAFWYGRNWGGLPFWWYLNADIGRHKFDGEGWWEWGHFNFSNGSYSFSRIHTNTSGGASVRDDVQLRNYVYPDWWYESGDERYISGPLSYTSDNYAELWIPVP